MNTSVEDLREKLSNLSPSERKLLKAELYGYKRGLPPTIDEYIESDYFMGRSWKKMLYPRWREFLREIFPDEITTTNVLLCFSMALGTGKTTVAVVIGSYVLCRALYLEDFSRCGIYNLDKPLVILFNHTSSEKAYQECVKPMWDAMARSVFWTQRKYPFPKKFEIVGDSLRSNKAVGTNLIFASFSEVNFVNESKMKQRINTIINRYENRFMNFQKTLGNIILDSSPTGTDSLVEQILRKTPFEIKIIHASIWEIKGFLGGFSEETFDVYAGDDTHKPYIVDEDHPLFDGHDPDRVLHVPMNLYPNFKTDVVLALQDKAGLSVNATGSYIANTDKIDECFCMEYKYADCINVKFNDPEDTIIAKYDGIIQEILPRDRRIFIHVDLGLTGDAAGLSAGYYAGDYIDDAQSLQIKHVMIKVPFSIRITRKKGEETSIPKITEFIIWLSTIYEIYVSMDTFQSSNLHQNLDLNKIKNCYLSVDRTTEPYNFLKMEIYLNLIAGVNFGILRGELKKLKQLKNKIDHPKGGSKDCADSVCGVAWNIRKNLSWAAKLPKNYQLLIAAKALRETYGNKNDAMNQLTDKISKLTHYSEEDDD